VGIDRHILTKGSYYTTDYYELAPLIFPLVCLCGAIHRNKNFISSYLTAMPKEGCFSMSAKSSSVPLDPEAAYQYNQSPTRHWLNSFFFLF